MTNVQMEIAKGVVWISLQHPLSLGHFKGSTNIRYPWLPQLLPVNHFKKIFHPDWLIFWAIKRADSIQSSL